MRVGMSVWHAKRTNELNAEIGTYEKPTEIVVRFNYFTVVPAVSRGFMEVLKSGETLYDTWTGVANAKYFQDKFGFVLGQSKLGFDNVLSNQRVIKQFKEGDLFWLDGEIPPLEEQLSETFGYKESATAILTNVAPVNHSLSLRFERNQNQVKQ